MKTIKLCTLFQTKNANTKYSCLFSMIISLGKKVIVYGKGQTSITPKTLRLLVSKKAHKSLKGYVQLLQKNNEDVKTNYMYK